MAETQAKPIATLITEDIFETLGEVTTANSYSVTLKRVERLNKHNHEFNNPDHLVAIVDPGDPQKQEEEGVGDDEFVRTYIIHVWLMPSQTDEVPIDQLIDAVVADVTRALCDDVSGTNRRDGLAIDTWTEDPETIGPLAGSLAYIINIPVNVQYTTRTRNLYQQTET